MRTELHITRGLPASGKTTFALAWVAEDPVNRVRVNRDSFRAMFHGHAGTHDSKVTEPLITKLAHDAARAYLRAGVSVIVDDTNLRQRTAREWATLAKVTGAELVVHDFTDVPLEECHKRNAERPVTIPAEVIDGMHRRYLTGRTLPLPHPEADEANYAEWEPVEHIQDLPDAIIVDIDGTVARCGDRDIYDGSKAHLDTPHHDVIALIHRAAAQTHHVIFMTGRDEDHRTVTEEWLKRHCWMIYCGELHMRPAGDKRKDATVKYELFNQNVRGKYNIAAAFDDRNQVVELWRAMGIRTYQVADGNF